MQEKYTDCAERLNSTASAAVPAEKADLYKECARDRRTLRRGKDREPPPDAPQFRPDIRVKKTAKQILTREEQKPVLAPLSYEVGGGTSWKKANTERVTVYAICMMSALAISVYRESVRLVVCAFAAFVIAMVQAYFADKHAKMTVSSETVAVSGKFFGWDALTEIRAADSGILRVYAGKKRIAWFHYREQNAKRFLAWAQQRGVPVRYSSHCPLAPDSGKRGKKKT